MRRISLRRLIAAALAVVCGWVAYAVYAEIAASHSLDSRLRSAQQQNAQLRHQIDQRKAEIAQAQTREWLVEEARKLGYVLPGEQVYVVTTPGASLPAGGGIDLKTLPIFNPSPSPGGTPAPTPTPVAGPRATPTPFTFTLPTPGH
jgi:cell division protein FtsB